MTMNDEFLPDLYLGPEIIELERAKKIRNNHFVQMQANKFNSFVTVHDVLFNCGFLPIEQNDGNPLVRNIEYIRRDLFNISISIILDDNNEILYIESVLDGSPQTAFNFLVTFKYDGNDYAAALDIYKDPRYSVPPRRTAFHMPNHSLVAQPPNTYPARPSLPTPPLSSKAFSSLPTFATSYPAYPTFQPSAYGIGDWMKFEEYLNNDLFSDAGIPLCFVESDHDNLLYKLYYSDERHLITIAPNGTGKGTCAQMPVLFQYDAPMLVIDPKGENAAITAKYRQDGMKHKVFILNPFNTLAEHFASEGFESKETNLFESACFNPLAALNPEDDNFFSDVASLSEALIDTAEKEPFWSDSARELVTCLILFICTEKDCADKRNLIEMRRLLTQDKSAFLKTMSIIARSDFGSIAQKARAFIDVKGDNKTIQSIILNAISQTRFLDDPILAKNLVSNDIDFLKLKEGKMTVYVILPAKQLLTYSKWFKLVVTSALNAFMSTHKQGDKKVLVMLDECPILGRLTCIETAVGLARGYGIQLWSFWQDIHQLYDTYKDRAESFLANAGVQQYFTPNDMAMAEKLSKRLGDTTIFSANVSYSLSGNNQSISFSERAVPFKTFDKFFGLPKDRQILLFSEKEKAVFGIKLPYHDDPDCKDKASNNPYFKK